MKEIILEANEAETIVFNVAEMAERFNNLKGTRGKRGKIYSLGMVLTLVILAKLAGEDKPWPIAEWIKLRKDVLVKMFTWHRQRVPGLNTIREILQKVISLEELEKAMWGYRRFV